MDEVDKRLLSETSENSTAHLEELVDGLKKRLKYVLAKNRYYKKKLNQQNSTNLEKIFNRDQLEHLGSDTHSRKGFEWSEATMNTGLKLYLACGTKGYECLRSLGLPYPCVRSVQTYMKKSKS